MEEQPTGDERGTTGSEPGAFARIGPAHVFVLAAGLQLVAIPLPWASARILEGSVTIDGFEAAFFGFCALVCGLLCGFAAVACSRGARGWMVLWSLPALLGSLLFAVAMVVLDSMLASAIEWVFAERAAEADAGIAVWLVLAAGVLTAIATGWGLVSTPLPPDGRPGFLRATVTLPPVLWRATRGHFRGPAGAVAVEAPAPVSPTPAPTWAPDPSAPRRF